VSITEWEQRQDMTHARAGDWVRVHGVVLEPGERAPQVPDDTKAVPLEIWLKGRLAADAMIGDEVDITTTTGRAARGTLVEVNPAYELGYGVCRPELLKIGGQVRGLLFGEGNADA
jgi:hypothetical protein